MSTTWPFVGRDAEVVRLVARVLDPGVSGGVVLVGPAGIGKSALLHHVSEQLVRRGVTPLHVQGSAAAAPVPLGPFAPVFSELGITQSEGFAALAALRTVLRDRTTDTVLIVDDVGRMDAASVLAIAQMMRGLRLRALLTVRDDEIPAGITELCDQGIISVEEVAPLSPADVQAIASEHLGGPLSPRAALALVEHVEGNPLHLRELLRASQAQGTLEWSGTFFDLTGELALGQRVTDLVGRRFEALDPAVLDILELLAAGQPLHLGSFDAAVVQDLERSGLVDRDADATLRLGHPLYDDVLRSRSTPSWWRSVQARAAELLRTWAADRPGDRAAADAIPRAIVLDLAAGTPTPPEDLAHAAAWAAGRGDPALAARLASHALESSSLHLAHLVLGASSAILGDLVLAETHLGAATETAVTEEDFSRLAGPLGMFWGTRLQQPAKALAALNDLAMRSGASKPAPMIRSEMTFWRMMSGQAPGDLFPDDGAAVDQLSAAINQAMVGVVAGPLDVVAPAVTRGLPLAQAYAVEVPHGMVFLRFAQVASAALAGDLNEARALSEQFLLESESTGGESTGIWQQTLGTFELTLGDSNVAYSLALDAQRNLTWRDPGGVLPASNALAYAAAVHQGRPREIARTLAALGPTGEAELRVTMLVAWARARALRDQGDIAAAVAHVVDVGHLMVGSNHVYLGALLLHVAVRLGSPGPVLDTLAGIAETSGGGLVSILHAHALAVHTRDCGAMADLVVRTRVLGSVSLAADIATQLTTWLHDDDAAFPSRTWLADMRTMRAAAGAQGPWTAPYTPKDAPFRLTERECDVARLAADRHRSRDIGEELGISVRTVDNHLRNIYRKLGVNTRTELADALNIHGENDRADNTALDE